MPLHVLKRTVMGAAALVAALTGAQAQGTIKIGALLAVTGPASFLGEPEEKTLKMYVEAINAKGGVNGQKIELVIYDDGGDASKSRTFATRLIEEDKVVAILGPSTSGPTMAIVQVIEDAGIPMISFGGAAVVVEPVKKFIFKTPHSDRMACEKVFEHMKKKGLSKVGLITGTDAFGKSIHDGCVQVAPKYGVEIVGDETYNPTDKDMTPQLTNLKGKAGIQAIMSGSFGAPAAIVTKNVKQVGITVPFYQNHGVASKSWIELSGDAAEGVLLPAAAVLVAEKLPDSDPQKKVALDYKTTYEKATGKPISTFGGHSYDGLIILVQAIERAKSADPKKIRDEIEKTQNFIGTAGIFNMTPADHMGLTLEAFKMLTVKGGDWALAD